MPKISINNIVTNKYFEPALFLVIGGSKTAYDYLTVKDKYKNKVLLNDLLILTGASAGIFGCKAIQNKKIIKNFTERITDFADKKFKATKLAKQIGVGKLKKYYKPLETPIKYSKEIIYNSLSNTAIAACGFAGAILTDFGLSKLGLSLGKYKRKKNEKFNQLKKVELFMNNKLDTMLRKEYRDEAFAQVTDFKVFSALTSSFIGLESIKLTREESPVKQIKKARKYLITDSLVPFFLLSLTTTLTKKMKALYRIPIIGLTTISGTIFTKQIVKQMAEKSKG